MAPQPRDEAPGYLVGSRDRLVGSMTRERLAESVRAGVGAQPVTSITDDGAVHVHPDHPIDIVLERFVQSAAALPVFNWTDARRVEGVITIDSIVNFIQQRRHQAGRPVFGVEVEGAGFEDDRGIRCAEPQRQQRSS